jgi:RNA polymerase sporulation-specific sigma factor
MTLSETERYIMIYRFGICGKDEKTQKTIAKELDISQAYVSKLEKDCLEKMRKYMLAEDLKNGVLGKNQYFSY